MDACCPVVVFAFNRPMHLQTTLDALAVNSLSESTDVTIICDGPRGPQEVALTTAVQQVAHGEKRFRSVTVQVNPENRGLASNIISGVTAMLEAHGRVIVLEDDQATSPYFLTYMNDALNLYVNDATVASIQGWCFPHVETDAPDTFFCGVQTAGAGQPGSVPGKCWSRTRIFCLNRFVRKAPAGF